MIRDIEMFRDAQRHAAILQRSTGASTILVDLGLRRALRILLAHAFLQLPPKR